MSDLHEAAEAAKAETPEWVPPDGTEFVEEDEQPIPGGPVSKVRRVVVNPVLRPVPTMLIACPRCNAQGNDNNPEIIAHLGGGGLVRLDCSQCGLAMLLKRGKTKEPSRIVIAGEIPEPSDKLKRILALGKGRR